MTAVATARRKQALIRFWAGFRTHRGGVAGLAVLAIAVVLALIAPLFIDESVHAPDAMTRSRSARSSVSAPHEPTRMAVRTPYSRNSSLA